MRRYHQVMTSCKFACEMKLLFRVFHSRFFFFFLQNDAVRCTVCHWFPGEDEASAFLDGPPNNLSLSKQPEKGILKKSGGIYGPLAGPSGHGSSMTLPLGMAARNKEKWSEESQSDNQEVMSVLMSPDGPRNERMTNSSMSDVERTLKNLNGYHEDILQVWTYSCCPFP